MDVKNIFRSIVNSLWVGIDLYLFVECYHNAVNLEHSRGTRVLNIIFAILLGVCIYLEIYKVAEKVSNEHKHDLEDEIEELQKRIKELESKD